MVCRPGHENDPIERIRHSAAHLMASAVQELFPGTKVTIGPVIDNGFFYDFDASKPFTPDDLQKIEKRMGELVGQDLPFKRSVMSREEAVKFFRNKGEKYKVEIIEGLPEGEEISLYRHGDWVDLCKGPHVGSTGEIKAFKLLSVAGAYWRGDEKNPMLQRIYGTAFLSSAELEQYLHRLKEAEARDHRKLGRELDLFSTMDEEGAGLVLWHPKGARIRRVIEDFWREAHEKAGYEILFTPHVARRTLWKKSGHLDFYKDYLFSAMEMEGIEYQLKPMNCPFHNSIYKSRLRSYRELPLRWAELGTVYRYERSGVLHGLLRVRGFTQDDAHLYCRPDQLETEVGKVLDFVFSMLKTFGFDQYEVMLSTRPEKSVGTDEDWERATTGLKKTLERRGTAYQIDPGEGVFYGPKIDIKIKDVLDRAWQCSTIQIDFNLPKRFDLEYVAEDGSRQQPIMIHRTLLGSLERFLGVLIEHYAGAFPAWLAPVQVAVLAVAEDQIPYAREVAEKLRGQRFRIEEDYRNEKLGGKIRNAELQKIPYIFVIGKREKESGTVSVRSRREGDLGALPTEQAIRHLEEIVKNKEVNGVL
ncbi:MAG: threonine--tRNA ligase [Deltaproteobacteria bacterium]|nr:threonine--tRNA ligase [Deltaproteobacteria bacterium]